MKLAGRNVLHEFVKKHSSARKPLEHWKAIVEAADWKTPHDVKQVFGSADFIGKNRVIFNIGGNKFRLVARVIFLPGVCRIQWIGTHSEYDKIDWKKGVG
jgi:mRNA interferase HigB